MPTMIRRATADDVPGIGLMAEAFVASTEYRALLSLKPEFIAMLAEQLITNDNALALVCEADGRLVGMMGVLAFPHMMSGETIATEVVWWMEPDHRGRDGIRMLRQAEAWAKEQGATILQMIAPNIRIERFYDLLGYVPVERSYQKRLS